jgi:elongation factor Ts
MGISVATIKQLREATGAGVLDCRKALEHTGGDLDQAQAWLKDKGLVSAAKKSDRVAKEGLIGSYIHHNNRVAVLIEVNCETDFVALTERFKTLTQTIAKHIAMANPKYIKPDDIPAAVLDEARRGFEQEAQVAGTADSDVADVIAKKLDKFYEETCLLAQPYVLNDKVTIGALVAQGVNDLNENVVVRRFVRYELGAE